VNAIGTRPSVAAISLSHPLAAGLGAGHIPITPILVLVVVAGGIWFGVSRRGQRRRRKDQAGQERQAGGTGQESERAAVASPPLSAAADSTLTSPPRTADPVLTSPPRDAAPGPASPLRADLSPRADLSGRGGWAVEAHGLRKKFGDIVAVDDVDLRVPRGSAFGYLGPNGAGKTTLIRTLLGLTRANGGTTSLLGIRVPAQRRQALARVGAIVDEPRFHHHLTGRENLRLLAAARGGNAGRRIGPALERVGLAQRADDKVRAYSMGMRQRLGVAACLLADPELLILDEPMNGLDPAGMHEMREMIRSLADEGRAVMLSSHLLDEVERTCDAVAIVDHGRVIRQGPIDELVHGGGGRVVRLDCSDLDAAARLIEQAGIGASTSLADVGLTVTLPAGASREAVADVNRRLVEGGISVYSLQEVQASLEDWFLSVTTRLGEQ
jgi:ABC-2 type transport system ATP-binding protein